MLRIITDFDGPIMDVSERYYRVYQFCLDSVRLPDQEITPLSKGEFWQMKRSQIPEREIGRRSRLNEAQAQEFARLRKQTVHTLPYLVHDAPVPGAIETLERIQKIGIDPVVMTMRRVQELDAALNQYDLARFFPPHHRYCLSNDYAKTNDVQDKTILMGQALAELPPATQTWMIGDTEADIISAKTNHIPVIAVLSGIRDRTQLQQYAPNQIVNSLGEAIDFILSDAVGTRGQELEVKGDRW
jgi:phosphoglycolate phosphatase-like HAD superfamily hydrolase